MTLERMGYRVTLVVMGLTLLLSLSVQIKNITDVRLCKVTHNGMEYAGTVFRTESGQRCQFWEAVDPVHKVPESIQDADFPENSKIKARNFCRNPTGDSEGPWCYTLDEEVMTSVCDVPICIYKNCRLTGPGVEYSGDIKKTGTDEDCNSWGKKNETGFRFSYKLFPDESRKDSKSYCRNPDDDPGGPWCFVDTSEKKIYRRRYCDVPFCEDLDCMQYCDDSKKHLTFTHFTSLNTSLRNLTFALKLWHPGKWRGAEAHLVLSVLATPATGEKMVRWGAAVELVIGNVQTGFIVGGEEIDMIPTPGLIRGTHWSWFWLKWGGGFISVGQEGSTKSIITEQYEEEGKLLGLKPDTFYYYSFLGPGILWNVPLCVDDCEVHTTGRLEFQRFFPLRETPVGHDAHFYVRAFHSACVEFRKSPAIPYPNIRIFNGASTYQRFSAAQGWGSDRTGVAVFMAFEPTISRMQAPSYMTQTVQPTHSVMIDKENFTFVSLQTHKKHSREILQEVSTEHLLSYWEWHEFTISIFGDQIQVFLNEGMGVRMLLDGTNDVIRELRWFSVASSLSIAHWTIFCIPSEDNAVPIALPPECAGSRSMVDYSGSQWATATGSPCLPWVDEDAVPAEFTSDNLYIDGSRLKAKNYCRNIDSDQDGPWCFTMVSHDNQLSAQKRYCHPRQCQTSECRMSGTANDYIGKLNVTRSNRTCQMWTVNSPHKVNKTYLNETLFPERSIDNATNYCRNPSKNIAGTWCYTTDPDVPTDLCDVYDCVKPEECIALTRGVGYGRLVYIMPHWRRNGLHFALKEWDPDLSDAIVFRLYPLKGTNYIKLIIGAFKNEKILLLEGRDETGMKGEKMLKQKTFPHLIPIGRWGGFWIKMQDGKLTMGYEGIGNALFEWIHPEPEKAFNPMFMSYTSLIGHTIGVAFPCDECHIEKTSTVEFTKILPIGLWSKHPGSHYNNLTLYLRGTGFAIVPLIKLPGLGDYFALLLGKNGNEIILMHQKSKNVTYLSAVRLSTSVLDKKNWTRIIISFSEHNFTLRWRQMDVITYTHTRPLLFYWFTLSAKKGTITWAANCEPVDLDGPPINGGWSEWGPSICSVTCGGGKGVQTRTCSNPKPNIYGKDCEGSSTLTGTCNEYPCGELSPDTVEFLKNNLQREHFSIEMMEGDSVLLRCNQKALERIDKESPDAEIEWTKNGMYLSKVDIRIHETEEQVAINDTEPEDSGVYICSVLRVNKLRTVVRVISLAVKPRQPTVITRETFSVPLHCNSHILGYIYSDMSQKWEVNNHYVWKDYGITTLAAVDMDTIPEINASHMGEWRCIIEQQDLGFKWVTNWIIIHVKHAPTFLTHLMEDKATAPLFGRFQSEQTVLIILISIGVFTVVFVVIGVIIYIKFCTLPQRQVRT